MTRVVRVVDAIVRGRPIVTTPAPTRLGRYRARVASRIHDEGEGPPVLLLHGFPAVVVAVARVPPLLAARFRVIAPDLLGLGPRHRPTTWRSISRRRPARCESSSARSASSGTRWWRTARAAGVAQLLALDGDGVDALVLLDACALDAWPSRRCSELAIGCRTSERDAALVHSRVLARRSRPARSGAIGSPTTVLVLTPAAYGHRRRARRSPSARGMDGRGLVGREAELGASRSPALILWGEDDPLYPATRRRSA